MSAPPEPANGTGHTPPDAQALPGAETDQPRRDSGASDGRGRFSSARTLKIGAVTLGIVFAAVLALPTVLSQPGVLKLALKCVNARIDGTLDVEACSLGWASGISIRKLSFDDRRGASVQVGQVSTPAGLWSLIGRQANVGKLVLQDPVLTLAPQPATEPAPAIKAARPRRSRRPEARESATPAPQEAPAPVRVPIAWDLAGDLSIRNARVEITPAVGPALVLTETYVDAHVDSLNKPVTFDARVCQGAATGDVRADAPRGIIRVNGTARVVRDGVVDPDAVLIAADVDARDLDLAPLAALVPGSARCPAVRGRAQAQFRIEVAGASSLLARGNVTLTSVRMTGGGLGDDTPAFDEVRLAVDASARGMAMTVRQFVFTSPVLRAAASGELAPAPGLQFPRGKMACDATVDLAALAAAFPRTLRLQDNVTVTRGQLVASAQVQSGGEELAVRANAETRDIAANRNGRPIALDAPVRLNAVVALRGKAARVDDLSIRSGFAQVDAKGDMERFHARLSADLAKAMAEVGRFVDFGKLKTAGSIQASAVLATRSPLERKVTMNADVRDLSVAGLLPEPIVERSLKASLAADVHLNDDRTVAFATNVSLNLAGAELEAVADAARVTLPRDTMPPSIAAFRVHGAGNLGRLTDLARGTGRGKTAPRIRAGFALDAKGTLANGVLALPELSARLKDVQVTDGRKKLAEPQLDVAANLEVRLAQRSATVRDLRVTSSAGSVQVPRFGVRDWSAADSGLEAEASLNADLAKLDQVLGGFSPVPDDLAVSGVLDAGLRVGVERQTPTFDLKAGVNELRLQRQAGAPIHESRISLEAAGRTVTNAKRVDLDRLNLRSSVQDLRCSGALTYPAKTGRIDLAGTLEWDFARMAEWVLASTGRRIEIEGRQTRDFRVSAPLNGADWTRILRDTTGTAGVYVQRLKMFGMEARELAVDLSAGGARATASVETRVNHGDVLAKPTIDVSGKSPFLTLPGNSDVLRGVKLTDSMMSDLLGRIHPLLRECSVVSGEVDLRIGSCRVPLDGTRNANMTVTGGFTVTNLVLAPAGLLRDALVAAKVDADRIEAPVQNVGFTCANGRIESTPLTFLVDGQRVTVAGSVGLDQTLRYVVEVPVSRKTVSQELYKYVQNARLQLHVGGTVTQPRISSESLNATLGSLLEEAAKNLMLQKGTKLLDGLLRR